MRRRHTLFSLVLLLLAACGGGGGNGGTSSDASLSLLRLDDATLTPTFSSDNLSYTATVVWAVQATRVTAVTRNTRARMTVNGTVLGSGVTGPLINLPVGDTDIAVVVTAQDGTTRTYTVRVTRPLPGNDASLADLTLSAGPLIQPFDPLLTSYDADFGFLAASTRVFTTPTDPLAGGATVNGVAIPAGRSSLPVALPVGDSLLSVLVTAEDLVTTRTYQVTANRADFATLSQRAYVKATNTNAGDRFGSDLALSGDDLLVTAPYEQSSAMGIDGNRLDNSLTSAGAAYFYERIGGVWTDAHYLKASNTNSGDRFGWSAALADPVLVIGAPGEQSLSGGQADNSGDRVGAAYVFEPTAGGALDQTGYLKASSPDSLDEFGSAVAVASFRILIGAPGEASNATSVNGNATDNSVTQAGAAYLFEPVGDWVQTVYFKASNTGSGTDMEFGSAVAISGDIVAIGARGEDSGATGVGGNQSDTSETDSGAVYLFERSSSGVWSQTAYVKASNTGANHRFGTALALDGNLLAVGAPGENTAAQNSGAVYVFARTGTGVWQQEAFLKPAVVGLNDFFGAEVSLVGNLLAVGSPGEASDATGINGADSNQNAPGAGAVYLFERQANGTWQQIAFIKASNTDAGDGFGSAIALNGDTLATGAPAEQSNATGVDGNSASNALANAGAVYLYR